MKEKPYHHGNLQTELIEEGLALIHEEGRGNFSLRKLAKRLGVSPTACYNHYPTVDELLAEMKRYVKKKFSDALIAGVTDEMYSDYPMLGMGKAYVNFFAENPHYFTFVYDSDDYRITLTEHSFEGDFEPFHIFKDAAVQCMEEAQIEEANFHDNLVAMWAATHGLAAMANMKGFHYDGDWGQLAVKLLLTKVTLC